MISFDAVVRDFRTVLGQRNLRLVDRSEIVKFHTPIISAPIFAIPDVHLCDGGDADIFVDGDGTKPARFARFLAALLAYLQMHPAAVQVVQLGDWFDVWRVCGEDPTDMTYGAIAHASAYRDILDLDAQIGLAHVIGNHDAAFLSAIPDMRATQPSLFRLGFWLGGNVYALHGHQSDVSPPQGSSYDELAVHAANVIGGFVPGMATFQAYIDRLGTVPGIKKWLIDAFTRGHVDPGPRARPADRSPFPPHVSAANFVVREDVDALATIVHKVERLPGSQGRLADVLIVGHSHSPCVSWTQVGGRPLVVVDAGAWVYKQANLLIAAGDCVAVFDVV